MAVDHTSPVTIPYSLLVSPDASLSPLISRAFSSDPTSLGLLIVSDLPDSLDFPRLRKRLLLLGEKFARLPEEVREKYADSSTKWSFGWSCGKEIMNGKPDTLKGSYYNNPTTNLTPAEDPSAPAHPNIWPVGEEGVDGFEEAFMSLCAVLVSTGLLVARACEDLTTAGGGAELANVKSVERLLGDSHSSKARLLHYFAREGASFDLSSQEEEKEGEIDDSWCGTHVDHSLLTALCPGMYLFHPTVQEEEEKLEPIVIPAPSLSTGLFIKTRAGETIRAPIPENCLAFQTGETLTLLSSNRLAATPHFVNSTSTTLSHAARQVIQQKIAEDSTWAQVKEGKVTRETLACFLQPNVDEVVSKEGETFGEFGKRVRERHY